MIHVIDNETETTSKLDLSFTGYNVHSSSIVAKRISIESLTKNRKERNMFKTKQLVFSIKRGGELVFGTMLIQLKLDDLKKERLNKEINNLASELKSIKKHHTKIDKYLRNKRNNNNNNTRENSNASSKDNDNNNNNNNNNNNDDDDDNDDNNNNEFIFTVGELKGKLIDAIAYVLKIKSSLKASQKKDEIANYQKTDIRLKYTEMINTVSKIEDKIKTKKTNYS